MFSARLVGWFDKTLPQPNQTKKRRSLALEKRAKQDVYEIQTIVESKSIIGGSIRIEYTPFRCRQKDNALECVTRLLPVKVDEVLSRREKKAAGLEQHKKLQREKELKRKEKKQASLPAKHSKDKK
jgi:hypothetical protein